MFTGITHLVSVSVCALSIGRLDLRVETSRREGLWSGCGTGVGTEED